MKRTAEHNAKIAAAHLARGVGKQPKRCPTCEVVKPRDEFGRRKDGKSRAECKACAAAYSRLWAQLNPEKLQARNRAGALKRYFGLTVEDYERLAAAQNHRCAICMVPAHELSRGRLFVDHCATTGRIRGLLCSGCNTGIGGLRHDPAALRRAADYVERPPVDPPIYAKPGMPCGVKRARGTTEGAAS
jgi:hypothetical protein